MVKHGDRFDYMICHNDAECSCFKSRWSTLGEICYSGKNIEYFLFSLKRVGDSVYQCVVHQTRHISEERRGCKC